LAGNHYKSFFFAIPCAVSGRSCSFCKSSCPERNWCW